MGKHGVGLPIRLIMLQFQWRLAESVSAGRRARPQSATIWRARGFESEISPKNAGVRQCAGTRGGPRRQIDRRPPPPRRPPKNRVASRCLGSTRYAARFFIAKFWLVKNHAGSQRLRGRPTLFFCFWLARVGRASNRAGGQMRGAASPRRCCGSLCALAARLPAPLGNFP